MLTITTRQNAIGEAQDSLILPFDLRQKSRLRARLTSGEEVALMLERGGVLRGGDKLATTDGRIIEQLIVEEGWIVALDRNGLAGQFEQRIDFDPRTIKKLEIVQVA